MKDKYIPGVTKSLPLEISGITYYLKNRCDHKTQLFNGIMWQECTDVAQLYYINKHGVLIRRCKGHVCHDKNYEQLTPKEVICLGIMES